MPLEYSEFYLILLNDILHIYYLLFDWLLRWARTGDWDILDSQ